MLFRNCSTSCLLLPLAGILVLLGQSWDHARHGTTAQQLRGFTSSCFAFHAVGFLRDQSCTEVVAGLGKAGDWVQVMLSACPSLLEWCEEPVLRQPEG